MPRYFVTTEAKGLSVLEGGVLLKKQQGEILYHLFFE